MSNAARAAVNLTDALRSGSLHTAWGPEKIQRVLGDGYLDQMDAARSHANNLAAMDEAQVQELSAYPEWVVLGVTSAWCSWVFGESKLCEHKPNPLRPEPVFAAAWKPRVIVCQRCVDLLADLTAEQAQQCDGCGATGDLIGAKIAAGPFVYYLAVCDGCVWVPVPGGPDE